jgi:hypothetical protein
MFGTTASMLLKVLRNAWVGCMYSAILLEGASYTSCIEGNILFDEP